MVVVMNSAKSEQRSLGSRSEIARALNQVCKELEIEVVEISAVAVQAHFAVQDARTKYEMACAIADFLPELAWKLPPPRKAWQSEHYRMAIFDAAGLALAYMADRDKPRTSLA